MKIHNYSIVTANETRKSPAHSWNNVSVAYFQSFAGSLLFLHVLQVNLSNASRFKQRRVSGESQLIA